VAKRRGRRTKNQEKIARERIESLLDLALKSSDEENLEQSRRFVELALLISKRYNQRLTKSQRLKICRDCNNYFTSKNSRNRLSPKGWKIITCLDCGSVSRHVVGN
tara:strand:+ start:598 stop:915 length:318 start_codon:yes stop_codon:yes gene_type:complete